MEGAVAKMQKTGEDTDELCKDAEDLMQRRFGAFAVKRHMGRAWNVAKKA